MPEHMIKNAAIAAYGKDELPEDLRSLTSGNKLRKEHTGGVQKQKNTLSTIKTKFQPGDSVMLLPDKKSELSVSRKMKGCFKSSAFGQKDLY